MVFIYAKHKQLCFYFKKFSLELSPVPSSLSSPETSHTIDGPSEGMRTKMEVPRTLKRTRPLRVVTPTRLSLLVGSEGDGSGGPDKVVIAGRSRCRGESRLCPFPWKGFRFL